MLKTNYYLVVLGDLFYPFGSASSNRIHAYSLGLLERNKKVLIINTNSVSAIADNRIRNYEGIDFVYPLAALKKNNFFKRRLINIVKPFYGFWILRRICKESKNFAILEFSTTFYQEIIYRLFASLVGIPIIREANEIPYHKVANKYLLKFKLLIYKLIRVHLYDGVIVISNLLEDFYRKNYGRNLAIIRIPILVDIKRFNLKEKKKVQSPYIAYIGSMDEKKDGVLSLIRAFAIIASQVDDYNLMLIGSVSSENKKRIVDLSTEKQIKDRVILKGLVERDLIPELLNNAKILALARPASRQNNAGFPTKLGEYLATGNPVVATQLGDIAYYLTHKESILLSPPGNINDLANNLRLLIENNNLAKMIGVKGKNVAKEYFNYSKYSASLSNYIGKMLQL
jgi:glycosyltransferase involved in cell wall biosynthesis